jgi:catechol 2,3-dioxygenase-like lactoylglutathione lyase family enzyme
MNNLPRFAHVNLIAQDWKALAGFYEQVFGCRPVPPERQLAGAWIDAATGMAGVRIQGAHLRLPGYGDAGPTLEIFQYEPVGVADPKAICRPGLAHLAFSVDDVPAAVTAVLAAGGSMVGEIVRRAIPGAGRITFVYVRDPEGNIVELQRWE